MVNKLAVFLLALSPAFGQTPTSAATDKPASVEGVVVNSLTGEPLPRVHVLLSGMNMDPRQYGAISTADGKFSITDIVPGKYVPTARRVGFVAPPSSYVTETLDLKAEDKKTDLKLKLIPTSAITGHITDSEGAPVEGANVTAENSGITQSSTTDDKGEYRIGGLAPGKYRVKAGIRNQVPLGPETRTDGTEEINHATTYYPGSVDARTSSRVEVRAAVEVSGVDIRLARYPWIRVSGHVIGLPPGVVGTVNAQLGMFYGTNGMLHKDGSFEIWRLDPGKYTLTASWNNSDRLKLQSTKTMIEVAGSNIENVEIRILPPVNLAGHLEFDDDQARQIPQPPRQIAQPQPSRPRYTQQRTVFLSELGTRSMGASPAVVGPDDTFTLTNVPPSRYRVEVTPGGAYVKSVRLGSVATDGPVLDLSQGASGDLSLLLSSATGSVSGIVQDDSAAGARIVLVPADGDFLQPRRYAVAQADGSYSFTGLPPGPYQIVAVQESDNDLVMQQNGIDFYEGLMDDIEVHSGDKITKDLRRRVPN